MAEVVGTAVGVISFGISVCQGVTSYLRSIRGREKRISDALNEVEALMTALNAFKRVLPDLGDNQEDDVKLVQVALTNCDKHLIAMEQLLLGWNGSATTGRLGDKLKRFGRAVTHPLREEELVSLQQQVQRLLSNLNQIKSTISLKRQIHVEEAQSSHRQRTFNQLSDLKSTLTSNLVQMNEHAGQVRLDIRDLDSKVGGTLTLIQDDLRAMGSANRLVYERVAELLGQMTTNSNSEVLRRSSDYDPYGGEEMSLHVHKPTACSCTPTRHLDRYVYKLWGVEVRFDQHKPPSHHKQCKLHGVNRTTRQMRAIQAGFPIRLAWLLGRINWMSVRYVKGINHVQLSLQFQNIVPFKQCKVCQQLLNMNIQARSEPPEACALIVKQTERSFLALYHHGSASPRDKDENGVSHALVSTSTMRASNRLGLSPRITAELFDGTIRHYLSRPANTITAVFSRTALRRYAIEEPRRLADPIGNTLIRGIISNFVRTFNADQTLLATDNAGIDMYEGGDIDTERMLKAICEQSMESLDVEIARNPESTTRRIRQHTLLQAAIPWPDGLLRLLATGAAEALDTGSYNTPFLLACRFKYSEALKVLMEAGCRIPTNYTAGNKATSFDLRCLNATTDECVMAFTRCLADRRRRLLLIAQETLGVYRNWHSESVPDSISDSICTLLDAHNITIPDYLTVPSGYKTIYHNPSTSLRHFPLFYAQGFRSFNSTNSIGLTASMIWRGEIVALLTWHEQPSSLLSTISWLEQHGFLHTKASDPLKLGLNTHATGWHYWATALGYGLWNLTWECWRTSLAWSLIRKLPAATNIVHDNCVCWCSENGTGCSPIKSLWKAYAARINCRRRAGVMPNRFRDPSDNPFLSTLPFPKDFIRFLTFEALEMTHTCCSVHRVETDPKIRLYNEDEEDTDIDSVIFNDDHVVLVACPPHLVDEMRTQDHEKRNAELLEQLMNDFDQQMNKMNLTSPKGLEHLLSYWRDKMRGLFDVNEGEVGRMKNVVGKVTCKYDHITGRMVQVIDD
ncbi:hypothetical protein QBC38DRAFT_505277 [Podospora fimiseda]|uniref:Fungal N-terminal domain-containing protein n=1 Tax=Podospora fimiseda TaxID=252190 RepID=A0AAN7BGF2_9PEZI|nr:hypothetical protein QBC38DRAFT_505277 [Podospora fimiseda]